MQAGSVWVTIKWSLHARSHHCNVAPTWALQSSINPHGAPLVAWLQTGTCTLIQPHFYFSRRWAFGQHVLLGCKGLLQGQEDRLGGGRASQVISCCVSGTCLLAETGCKMR